jgi:hypothetical protein
MAAMFLTSLLSWMFFDLEVNAEFILALVLCSISLLVYYGVISSWLDGAAKKQANQNEVELVDMPLLAEDFIDDEDLSDHLNLQEIDDMLDDV